MLNVLTTHTHTKGHKKSFGGVGCVYYLGCFDGDMDVCICLYSIKLYTLIMRSFLYTNYTSRKLGLGGWGAI